MSFGYHALSCVSAHNIITHHQGKYGRYVSFDGTLFRFTVKSVMFQLTGHAESTESSGFCGTFLESPEMSLPNGWSNHDIFDQTSNPPCGLAITPYASGFWLKGSEGNRLTPGNGAIPRACRLCNSS